MSLITRLGSIFAVLFLCVGRSTAAEPTLCSFDAFDSTAPRFALVIGNENYQRASGIFNAKHAQSDAVVMADRLCRLGFDTSVWTDISALTIQTLIENLRVHTIAPLKERGVKPLVVVYFAGHGFNIGGRGFIAGVDAIYTANDRRSLVSSSLAIADIEDSLSDSTLLLILDSCRSDVSPTLGNAEPHEASTPSARDQLIDLLRSPMVGSQDALSQDQESFGDYMVAYAAYRVGDVAFGGIDANGAYTRVLTEYLGILGDDISAELQEVAKDLAATADYRQRSNTEGGIGMVTIYQTPEWRQRTRTQWDSLVAEGNRRRIKSFKDTHADSQYSIEAQKWLDDDTIAHR
jgi:hypothetical protein